MDTADALPNDAIECQRLLLAAFKEATQLERRVVESEQRLEASTKRVMESEQEVAELKRVLEETAVSFEELRQEDTAALDLNGASSGSGVEMTYGGRSTGS